jgi:hypothetical protein
MTDAAYTPLVPRHDYMINDPPRDILSNTGEASCRVRQLEHRGWVAAEVDIVIKVVEVDCRLIDIRIEVRRGADDSAIFGVLQLLGDRVETMRVGCGGPLSAGGGARTRGATAGA